MKTKTFITVLFLLAISYVFAQHKISKSNLNFVETKGHKKDKVIKRSCGTMKYLEEQKTTDPKGFEKRMNLIETQIRQWKQKQANAKTSKTVIVIPTVIHVIWKTSTQNISDAQIISQIDVLNEDFRRLNADTTNTPGSFTGVAADCEIEFCLAIRDPSGNVTTGIIRTQTTTNSFNNDNVKFTSSGGDDAWPSADYFNIWVCNLGGGLLGYAQFPGGPANTDGVVIGYNYFGRIGTASPPFNKGRTTTHEIGHWLNLYHIWGDDGGSCTGSDNVGDTPNQADATYGCPAFPLTDACTGVSPGVMFQNYMDYSDDACMNIFTSGQKTRMVAVLNGSRLSIQSSQGCIPVNLLNLDAGIYVIITPNGTVCQSSIIPEITLKNYGLNTLTSVTINYQIDADSVNTYSWTGSLASLTTQNVTLPSITALAGAHTLTVFTSAPNGSIDDDTTNDTYTGSFTVQSIGDPLPFFEGFENPAFPPVGWQVINPDGSYTWERTTVAAKSSTASTRVENAVYSANEQIDELIFPNLNLTNVSYMTFDIAYQLWSQTGYSDTLEVLASTDCGSTFSSVYKKFGQPLTTVTPYWSNADFIPASNSNWRSDTVDLTAFSGFNNVILKFRNVNDYENNLYIDNINILVSTVANFTASPTNICAGENIAFTDQSSSGSTSWEWTFTGGTPAISTIQNPIVTYNTQGTYDVTLIVTNADDSDTLLQSGYIIVNPVPVVDLGSDTIQCGGTVTLDAGNSGTTFNWSTTETSQTIVVSTTGTYWVDVTYTNGCITRDSIDVAIYPLPTTNITPSSPTTFCSGDSVELVSDPAATYDWLQDGISTGVTDSNYFASVAADYQVAVTNVFGCSDTSVWETIMLSIPVVSVTPSPGIVCGGGDSIQLTASGAATYVWTPSDSLSDTTGSTVFANPTTASGNIVYIVKGTDSLGCTDDTTVTVNISIDSPVAIFSSVDTVGCGSLIVSFINASTDAILYSWDFPGGVTADTTVQNPVVTYNTVATFDVTLTAIGCGGVDSIITKTGYITVNPVPTVNITANSATTFCEGDSVELVSDPAATYDWLQDGISTGVTNINFYASVSADYQVVVTNNFGCADTSGWITVTVNPFLSTPLITANDPTTFCQGGSVTLTSSSAEGYLWSDSSTTQSIVISASGTYSVTVDSNGCPSATSAETTITIDPLPATPVISASPATTFCQGGSVTLTSSIAEGYLWSDSSTTQSITVTASGTFTVIVDSSNGCSSLPSAATTVTVNSLPVVIATPDTGFVCGNGDSVTLAASGAVSYVWSPSDSLSDTAGSVVSAFPTVNTTYTVFGTDANSCVNFTTVTVQIDTSLCSVGISELFDPTNSIKLYPNPTIGVVNIDVNADVNISSISVYNIIGSLVFEVTNSNSSLSKDLYTIDLSNQPNGSYVIRIQTTNGVIFKKINLIY